MIEEWRPVVGYEGYYEVSDHGRVRSLDRIDRLGRLKPSTVLKAQIQARGRRTVSLGLDGALKTRSVHHLVLESFVGPRPDGLHGCHWDDDPENNSLANLRWDTGSNNELDKVRNGGNHLANRVECEFGHKLEAPNLTPWSEWRRCLACHREKRSSREKGVEFSEHRANMKYEKIMQGRSEEWRKAGVKVPS